MSESMMDVEDNESGAVGGGAPPPPELRLFQIELSNGETVGVEAHAVHESDGVLVFSLYTRVPDSSGYIQSFPYMFKEWASMAEVTVRPGMKRIAN